MYEIGQQHTGTFVVQFVNGEESPYAMKKHIAMAYCMMMNDTAGIIDTVSGRVYTLLQVFKYMKDRATLRSTIMRWGKNEKKQR